MEDPNLHLSVFLEECDTLKINGASTDAIRLRLFPFWLRDRARAWLHSGVDLNMGGAHEGLSRQILSTKQDGEFAQSDYVLHSKRGRDLIWGVGENQGFAEVVAPSRSPEVDGGPDILQRGNSTSALNDWCSCRRDLDEQNRRGGVQFNLRDGIEQLPMVKRARPTQEG